MSPPTEGSSSSSANKAERKSSTSSLKHSSKAGTSAESSRPGPAMYGGRKLSQIHTFVLSRLPNGEAKEKYLRELIDFDTKTHKAGGQKDDDSRKLRKISKSVS